MTNDVEGKVKLLPCPFCGSPNADPAGWMSGSEAEGYFTGPACDDCGGAAGSIEHWNTRAPFSAVVEGDSSVADSGGTASPKSDGQRKSEGGAS